MPKKLTQEYVENYCLERGYRVMSPYINTNTKIKLKNIETDNVGCQTFHDFKQGHRFDNPNAALKPKLTYKEYIEPFNKEGYQVNVTEEEYDNINNNTKIEVICPNGHQWKISRHSFISNRRCPMCNQIKLGGMSHGEKLVYCILSGNNIDFKREYSVEINGKTHRFDFYFEINDNRYLIEYDGTGHYEERAMGYFSGKLKERQRRDRVKDQYAKDNGIIMIRIPYTENTVDKVVKMMNDKMGLTFHKVEMYLSKKQDVVDYYLTHEPEEIMNEFKITQSTIQNYALDVLGMSKTDYLIKIGRKSEKQREVVDYYLNHSIKGTADRFSISRTTVCNYAQDIWGVNKEKYFVKTGKKVELQKEIVDYYLEHRLEETMSKFRIGSTAINRYFKKEYGMSKKDYLKTLDK